MECYPGSHLLMLQPFKDHEAAIWRWYHLSTGFKRKADHLIEALLLPSARFTFQRNPVVLVHEKLGLWAKRVDLSSMTTEQALCDSIQGFWKDTSVLSTSAITMIANPHVEVELQALKEKVKDCTQDIRLATEAILDGLKLVVQGSNQTTSH